MGDLNNLKKLIEQNGRGEQKRLANAIGVSTGNVNDWLNPNKKANPNAKALDKIASFYQCSVDYLLGRTNNPKMVSDQSKIYRFPSYDQKAAAGVGILNNDSDFHMEEYVVDNIPDKAAYAMKISGESMYSEDTDYKIKTDSIVLVNPKYNDWDLEDKIVIVNFKGKTICKRYVTKKDCILFKSDNEEYELDNRKSTDDPNYKILGIVLGVIEDEKFIPIR